CDCEHDFRLRGVTWALNSSLGTKSPFPHEFFVSMAAIMKEPTREQDYRAEVI
uniref:MATH domain-containing protein n=1 Tax=Mesocestoides corti TaxID=53468 RepID=A0A5K3F211_MESCO